MSTNRVKAIVDFDLGAHFDAGTILNGLAACLTPKQKCEALVRCLFQEHRKRAILMRRIVADMEQQVQPCHHGVAAELLGLYRDLSGKERVTCAAVVLEIVEGIPGPLLGGVLNELLGSPNGNIRRQVYRRIKSRPELGLPDAVTACWLQHGDFDACRLIVDRGPPTLLVEWFEPLEAYVAPHGWLLARLYLRLAGKAPGTLTRLKAVDPITYTYLAAKLGRKLRSSELVAIYRQYLFDERAGLIVWSAGQMGRWNAIRQMQAVRVEPPREERLAVLGTRSITAASDQLSTH